MHDAHVWLLQPTREIQVRDSHRVRAEHVVNAWFNRQVWGRGYQGGTISVRHEEILGLAEDIRLAQVEAVLDDRKEERCQVPERRGLHVGGR